MLFVFKHGGGSSPPLSPLGQHLAEESCCDARWPEEALDTPPIRLWPLSPDEDLAFIYNECVQACEDIPAPVVVAILALLRAPSPLVVYAATVME